MIRRVIVLAIGLACGIAVSQVPEFVQQYMQRLGGQLDVLSAQIADLETRAAEAGLSRDAYVMALQTSVDPNGVREGDYLAELPQRFEAVRLAYADLTRAAPWKRGIIFIRRYEPTTIAATWGDFRPGIPVTTEGLGYGLVGFIVGWSAELVLIAPFTLRRRKPARKQRREPVSGPPPPG